MGEDEFTRKLKGVGVSGPTGARLVLAETLDVYRQIKGPYRREVIIRKASAMTRKERAIQFADLEDWWRSR